jgi:hypothetical protein
MIKGLSNQSNYVAAKKLLHLSALRHEASASDLANLSADCNPQSSIASRNHNK